MPTNTNMTVSSVEDLIKKYAIKNLAGDGAEFTKYISSTNDRLQNKLISQYSRDVWASLKTPEVVKNLSTFLKDMDGLCQKLNPTHYQKYCYATTKAVSEHISSNKNSVNNKEDLAEVYYRIEDAKKYCKTEDAKTAKYGDDSQFDNTQKYIREALRPKELVLGAQSEFYKFMMNQDIDTLARTFEKVKDGKKQGVDGLKPSDLLAHAPSELLDKIAAVSQKVAERDNTNRVGLFFKDILQQFCNWVSRKGKDIPGFENAMKDVEKCVASRGQQESKYQDIVTKDDKRAEKFVEMVGGSKNQNNQGFAGRAQNKRSAPQGPTQQGI